jgi:hypothetical protein
LRFSAAGFTYSRMARKFPLSAESETSAQTGRPMKSGELRFFILRDMKIPE